MICGRWVAGHDDGNVGVNAIVCSASVIMVIGLQLHCNGGVGNGGAKTILRSVSVKYGRCGIVNLCLLKRDVIWSVTAAGRCKMVKN